MLFFGVFIIQTLAKEKNKFTSKFGKLNSERAAFAISQRINKEILSNSSKI